MVNILLTLAHIGTSTTSVMVTHVCLKRVRLKPRNPPPKGCITPERDNKLNLG
jgi:hypothetical protein